MKGRVPLYEPLQKIDFFQIVRGISLAQCFLWATVFCYASLNLNRMWQRYAVCLQ